MSGANDENPGGVRLRPHTHPSFQAADPETPEFRDSTCDLSSFVMRFVHSSIALPYLLQRSERPIHRLPSLGVSSLDLGPHGTPLRLFFRLRSGARPLVEEGAASPSHGRRHAQTNRHRACSAERRCALLSDHLRRRRGAARPACASGSVDAHALARRLYEPHLSRRLAGRGRHHARFRRQAREDRRRLPDLARQHHSPGAAFHRPAIAVALALRRAAEGARTAPARKLRSNLWPPSPTNRGPCARSGWPPSTESRRQVMHNPPPNRLKLRRKCHVPMHCARIRNGFPSTPLSGRDPRPTSEVPSQGAFPP